MYSFGGSQFLNAVSFSAILGADCISYVLNFSGQSNAFYFFVLIDNDYFVVSDDWRIILNGLSE